MRKDVRKFLVQSKHNLMEKLVDQNWLLFVAYLTDIFTQLNILNLSLQGSNTMLVDVSEKLIAFREKLKLWKKIKPLKKALFPVFNKFLEDIKEMCFHDVHLVIEKCLALLIQFNLI